MGFDAKIAKEQTITWIREWFDKNGKGCKGVVGISGGKDSSVVAALLVEALGKENVFGVLMPNGIQSDIDMALMLVNHLDIEYRIINIKEMYDAAIKELEENNIEISKQTTSNLPPRLRMTTVYAVSQSVNGRVANTCNLSEDYVGYSTRYGDSVGDFSPIASFTVTEVKAIGKELNLPEVLINKIPADGLCGKTDEENLGFSYDTLDKYIRTGVCEDKNVKEKIDTLHERNKFKLELMPTFKYKGE